MSSTTGRVFSGLRRAVSSRGAFTLDASNVSRLSSVRSLSLSSHRAAKPTDEEGEVKDEPIKFSTSKASYRTWKVDQSLGSRHERPWWKVLPVSLAAIAFLLWCTFRQESDIDKQLEKQLYEQLPGLVSDEEEEKNSG